MITLYTTHCPKCHVLETKLTQKQIEYEEVTDIKVMRGLGILSVPVLSVDGTMMQFADANQWLNEQEAN